MYLRLAKLVPLLLMFVSQGCSSGLSQEEVDLRGRVNDLMNEGMAAFDKKDYVQAKQNLAEATAEGALRADFNQVAMVKLAISQAASGDAEAGLSTLNSLESKYSYLEDQVDFYVAKSYVLAKGGKRGEANAAWKQAKKLNPRARKFRE